MAVTRPLKEGSVTTYQQKVAAGFPDILASEVDADLDTIYAAWNGGVGTANLIDGSVTTAKLAANLQTWQTSAGNPITPIDATKNVAVLGDASWGTFALGSTTIKTRLQHTNTQGVAALTSNKPFLTTGGQDDATKPSWTFTLNPFTDAAVIGRAPAGSGSVASLLTLDATGQLTLPTSGANNPVIFGSRTAKGRLISNGGGDVVYLSCNAALNPAASAWVQDNAAAPSWLVSPDTSADGFKVIRLAAGGALTVPLTLDATGLLTLLGSVKPLDVMCTGSTAGLRCQNVGTMAGDGYSNRIAFGWNGTLQARVDSTALGSVNITPPSDARLKINVQEDVPGLAAVRALRPVSFEYDQSQRAIGFEAGRLYGLLAQEAQAVVPLIVEDDGSEEHMLSIDYRRLVPILLRAVQELAAMVAP
jgi:hypothetical protein